MEVRPDPSQVVRFGLFELDLTTGELRKGTVRVKLQDQPFRVLSELVRRPGELVTREHLREKLWPDGTFVDFDQNLHAVIKKVRRALGDSSGSPRFIETLPKRGYRFIYPIDKLGSEVPPAAQAPEVVGKADAMVGTAVPRSRRLLIAGIGVAAVVVLAIVAASGLIDEPAEIAPTPATPKLVAVLPLENLSGDPEQEYFSDGMTDALISELTRIDALSVLSRTSVMRYKERPDKSLGEIARDLGVDAAVEGSVLQAGDRIRFTVQLVDAETDTNLWGESYERDMREVLTLQREVARAIAQAVQVELAPQEEAHLIAAREVDPEVWQAYLRGRYLLYNKWDIEESIHHFTQALEKDPDYAPAHAVLSHAYTYLSWTLADPRLIMPRARTHAERALELDDRLAEAHISLAMVLFSYAWDWSGVERELKRAIELEPKHAMGHVVYGRVLGLIGRHDEAWAELRRAQELDPLSLVTDEFVGIQYLFERRSEEAVRRFHGILELEGTSALSHYWLGQAYLHQREYQEAIQALQRSRTVPKFSMRAKAYIAYAHAMAGNKAEALRALDELNGLSKERYVPPFLKAVIYAGLGDSNQAFQWLERAYEERDLSLIQLRVSPLADALREDSRFQDLLRRMNLPPLN